MSFDSTSITIRTQWFVDPVYPTKPGKWYAVATAVYYDPKVSVPPLTPVQVMVTGEALVSVTVRYAADSEAEVVAWAASQIMRDVGLRRQLSEKETPADVP